MSALPAINILTAPTRLTADDSDTFLASVDRWLAGAAADGNEQRGLDLAPLEHFDSAAVAVLVATQRRCVARGVQLRCVNAAPNLRKLAALYGVDEILLGQTPDSPGAAA